MNSVATHVAPPSLYTTNLTWSRPASASPHSLDHDLQVYLQSSSFVVSKCISQLAAYQLTIAGPSSFNHCIQVHVQTRSIAASKSICTLCRSRPQNVSLGSLDHQFQAQLQAEQDRFCISFNEMFLYPGVSKINTSYRWVHLRFSCISKCIYIERLR
jgi:hypothetical protein